MTSLLQGTQSNLTNSFTNYFYDPRNFCIRDFIAANPGATAGTFKTHWNKLSSEEKKVCFDSRMEIFDRFFSMTQRYAKMEKEAVRYSAYLYALANLNLLVSESGSPLSISLI